MDAEDIGEIIVSLIILGLLVVAGYCAFQGYWDSAIFFAVVWAGFKIGRNN